MQAQGLAQHVVGEPDAQKTRTASGPLVSYNIQSAVGAKYCLILHHEVTQEGTDNRHLEPMAKAAKEELQQSELCVTADSGYFNGAQFQACEDASIKAFVPPNRAINTTGGDEQYFDRSEFSYDSDNGQYESSAGNPLTLKQRSKDDRIYQAAIND